jgi:hypothetical protein
MHLIEFSKLFRLMFAAFASAALAGCCCADNHKGVATAEIAAPAAKKSASAKPMAPGEQAAVDSTEVANTAVMNKLEGKAADWSRAGGSKMHPVVVVLEKGADTALLVKKIESLGGKVTTTFTPNIYVKLPGSALSTLVADPDVWGIRPMDHLMSQ